MGDIGKPERRRERIPVRPRTAPVKEPAPREPKKPAAPEPAPAR